MGAIQGLTEFLPISSSAHLYIVPALAGWDYVGVAFDVALHWGTLIALLLVFWREWWVLCRDFFARDPGARAGARDTWAKIVVASIPTAVAGLLLQHAAETYLRSLPLQAAMLFVFGFLLWWVDRVSPHHHEHTGAAPSWKACLLIGAAQTLSLVPGVSRSGITMTAARAARMTRVASARFSFLLATPITFGAGLVEIRNLPDGLPVAALVTGMITSALVGMLAIRGLITWLGRAGFGVFFAYRAVLALAIVVHLVLR